MAQPIPAGTLLHSFRRHLEAENRSERTLASYLQSVRQAEAFLAGRGKRLEEASRADLEAFLGGPAASAGAGDGGPPFQGAAPPSPLSAPARTSRLDETRPSSRCFWTPAPAVASSPASRSRTWTSTWTCCWSSARVAVSGRCRLVERRSWCWTVTCGRGRVRHPQA